MSDDLIEIVLDGPPRGKGRPKFRTLHPKKGLASTIPGQKPRTITYTDAETRAYELKIAWQAKAVMRGRPPLDGPVHLTVIGYLPIPAYLSKADKIAAEKGDIVPIGKIDIDNIAKSAMDGINGIVFHDDNQVVLASICKFYSAKPRLRISVGRYIARGMGDDVAVSGAGTEEIQGDTG